MASKSNAALIAELRDTDIYFDANKRIRAADAIETLVADKQALTIELHGAKLSAKDSGRIAENMRDENAALRARAERAEGLIRRVIYQDDLLLKEATYDLEEWPKTVAFMRALLAELDAKGEK